MLGPFAIASRLMPIHQVLLADCRAPPAHRCPRQRQRVKKGLLWPHGMGPTNLSLALTLLMLTLLTLTEGAAYTIHLLVLPSRPLYG